MFLIVLSLLASIGYTSPQFPAEIESYLNLPCTPPCTICHLTNQGGVGTATMDFGMAAKQNGLVPQDVGSLQNALDAMDAAGVDSDGDGTPDIQELEQGTDPNPGGQAFCQVAQPVYGCSTSGGRGAGAWAIALVLAAIGLGRRR